VAGHPGSGHGPLRHRYVTARLRRHLPSLPGLLIMGGFLPAGLNTWLVGCGVPVKDLSDELLQLSGARVRISASTPGRLRVAPHIFSLGQP
jgi:hypothetical protein